MLTAGTLTVRHIEKSGREGLTMATTVEFVPGSKSVKDADGRDHVIAYGVPAPVSDGCNRYGDGTIYVMNEAGRTIAKYDLDRD